MHAAVRFPALNSERTHECIDDDDTRDQIGGAAVVSRYRSSPCCAQDIRANSFRTLASSSPTRRASPRMSWASTTSAALANNGLRKARARSNGRGCRAARLRPTQFIFSFTHSPRISVLRTLATPEPINDSSLTRLKEKLIKIGAKVVGHARYVAFQMAEVAISKNLLADILRMISDLRPKSDPAPA